MDTLVSDLKDNFGANISITDYSNPQVIDRYRWINRYTDRYRFLNKNMYQLNSPY